jgi:RHS repeat-associated protein
MVIDQTGDLANMKRHDYLPFGEELFAPISGRSAAQGYAGGDGVRQQFTQKERDTETGLDYFGARYYSHVQGRFTSADKLLIDQFEAAPQSWNLYTYVRNNPLRFIDPTGNQAVPCNATCQESKKKAEEARKQAEAEGNDVTTITTNAERDKEIQASSNIINIAAVCPPTSGCYRSVSWFGIPIGPTPIAGGAAQNGGRLLSRLFAWLFRRPVAGSVPTARTAINITARGLEHVLERHGAGGARTAGKSVFNAGEDIVGLIRQAETVPAAQQAGRTTFERVVNAGRTIGVDRATGQPTSTYTVITSAAGDLVTAFPGTPL